MFSTRWRKVARELWSNRTRTILVVASIAVGIFAVGVVQHLSTVLLSEMQAVYQESNASQAIIFTTGVDEAMLDSIRQLPEVADAQGRSSLTVKVQVAPEQWESLALTAIDDFDDIRIDLIHPVYAAAGHKDASAERTTWPAKDEIVLERSALASSTALPAGIQVGDTLLLETPDGKRRQIAVAGLVYDANAIPASFSGSATGYVTYETFERLGGSRHYDRVNLRVNGTPAQQLDEGYLTDVAQAVADKIEKTGFTVQRTQIPDPGQLPMQDLFDSLTLLLTPFGLLALGLSGFLVINTISALMAQQVRQIGVMKAIGAQRYQVVGMYLSAILIYSLAALALAVPMTVLVAGAIARFLGGFINMEFPMWSLPPNVLWFQIGVGVLAPLLAALQPVLKGAAVTVREAISDYGASATIATEGWLTRLLSSIRGLSRPLQLSLRNTFRRKGRLALTLITLILGGMIFMTVGSVRASLNGLIDTMSSSFQFDIQFQFARAYRTAQVEQVVQALPGVVAVESWGATQAVRVYDDGSESDPLSMTALPADSQMVQPALTAGRWLTPEDENAIVISQNVLAAEPDIQVGDTIVLEIGEKEAPWVVVGIVHTMAPPGQLPTFVNLPYYARLTSNVGRASSVQIKLNPAAALSMDEAATQLNESLEDAGFRINDVFTIDWLRRITGSFFDIIVYLLLVMGVLIATVGALGLMGTMSTNVLERTREIGVMRAIGASDGSVQQIVIVEGVFIGWISWLVGALLAFPAGALLANAVGLVLFQMPLPYVFAADGLVAWFCIVSVLAALASFLPAWNASRLTVREVLAYQ
jgi:putative ABC transport system permease protein